MSEIVDKIKKLALEEKEKYSKFKADILLLADDIRKGKLDLTFEKVEGEVKEHTACAIDGGKYEFDLGDAYLIMVKAVSVLGKYGEKKEIPPQVLRDFKIVSDYYGIDAVRKDSILLMLSLETSLLSKANCDVIFIDGPLLDPPVYDESAEEYFMIRRSVVERKKPIGIVKRFSHRFLIKFLFNEGYDLLDFRESYLVTSLIMELRKEFKAKDSVMLGWIDWSKIFQGKEMADLKGIEEAYKHFNLNLYSAYFQLNAISPVVRIDVVNKRGLEYVKSWGLEGEKEVTILNKIADKLSKISEEEARNYVSLFQMIRGHDFYSYLSKF